MRGNPLTAIAVYFNPSVIVIFNGYAELTHPNPLHRSPVKNAQHRPGFNV